MKIGTSLTVFAALVALSFIAGPLLGIWALNVFGDTLWPGKQIPYTFDTWLAAILLVGLFRTTVKVEK